MTYFINLRATSSGGIEAPDAHLWTELGQITASNADAEFTNAVRGRNLVLVTHGFNVDQQDGLSSISGWSKACQFPASALFVGVLWPGDSAFFPVLDYPVEGREAMRSAHLLGRYLNANADGAASISFVSHSLGARVVLETISRLKRDRVRRLVLMAGAIEDDCLSNEYKETAKRVDQIHVIASRSDWVLEFAFPIGNPVGEIIMHGHPYFRTALGRAGPANGIPAELRGDCCQIPDHLGYGHGNYLPDKDISPLSPPVTCTFDPNLLRQQDWEPRWSASIVSQQME